MIHSGDANKKNVWFVVGDNEDIVLMRRACGCCDSFIESSCMANVHQTCWDTLFMFYIWSDDSDSVFCIIRLTLRLITPIH
jgi:predicted nucleic acid-binding Zn finger protein